MEIKIKKLSEDAKIPKYAHDGDACVDLIATKIIKDHPDYIWFGTDIAMKIPDGYVGLLFPRSSISKTDLELANSIGVIDSTYIGEIQVRFNYRSKYYVDEVLDYDIGDKIAQLMIIPIPKIQFEEVDKLNNTERGGGGFGSSGK